MSNQNQYWRGAPSGNQEQYYQNYPEDDSGNYQYGYAGPSAPRGGADDVAGLSGGFAGMNIQDSPQHGQDSYSQYEYSGSRYGTSSGDYRQDQYSTSSPPAQSSSAASKAKPSSKSKHKGHQNDPKVKGSKKPSGKKQGQHSGYGPELSDQQEPFYAPPPRAEYDDGGKQGAHSQGIDQATRSAKGRDWGAQAESEVLVGEDYSDTQSRQTYQQGDYGQAEALREDYSDTPHGYQQGGYPEDNPSRSDFPAPTSGKSHKGRGKQRAEYHDDGYAEGETYGDSSAAEPGSSYTHPAPQEDPSYYANEDQEYPYGYGQQSGDYARSHRSKDTKSSSGKRPKDKPRKPHPPTSHVMPEDLSEQVNPELEAALAATDGYHVGMSDYPHGSSSMQDPYGREDDDSGQQTPRQATPSVAGRPPAIPPSMDPGVYEPYAPQYPQTSHDPGYGSTHQPPDLNYDPNPYSSYQNPAGSYDSAYDQVDATEPSTPFDTIVGDGTGGMDVLDSRYVVEHSSKFSAGEVFKVLWSEPRGSGRAEALTEVEERVHMGQRFYVGVRRFIVVANDEGHCTCVPILTYERRACTKRGVKPNKHGIVYAVGGRPTMLKNEPTLGFPAVRVQLDLPTEKLAIESRVNYSKLVTVEHNVRVLFIGSVVPDDVDIVNNAVDKCWYDKNRKVDDRRERDHNRDHKRDNHRDYNRDYEARRDRRDRRDRR
ncbi:hypothetical protein QBC34DRAFT_217348 [Podospora aff. communis PSN243]|uniref:DUF6590 domain-containing protein n=1 Tax=Podospora aff. communis PSN243 TaxID=3040156 RepID=A0AAV9GWR8_9PEZI|nr:hypothetical protein QBC34DRAFT_217348 [Podospora aff. communis PSN243]